MQIDREEIAKFVEERNRALRDMDMEWGRRNMPGVSDYVIEIAMHKARYECTGIRPELRQESRRWLEFGGFARLHGIEFPDDVNELPC